MSGSVSSQEAAVCGGAVKLLGETSVCVFVHVWKSCVFTEWGFKNSPYKREELADVERH